MEAIAELVVQALATGLPALVNAVASYKATLNTNDLAALDAQIAAQAVDVDTLDDEIDAADNARS